MITLPKSGLKLVEKKSKRSSFEIHPVCVPFMSKMAIVTLYIFPKRIFLRNSIKKMFINYFHKSSFLQKKFSICSKPGDNQTIQLLNISKKQTTGSGKMAAYMGKT
jgi:hypothetical protein